MTITIGKYTFDGPFSRIDDLNDKSGVYAILTRATASDRYTVVDIGESSGIRSRVSSHDRDDCWKRNKKAQGLAYTANYCNEATRMKIEKDLREEFNPPCGDR